MYNKIKNPKTGRNVNINSELGRNIITNYFTAIYSARVGGGSMLTRTELERRPLRIVVAFLGSAFSYGHHRTAVTILNRLNEEDMVNHIESVTFVYLESEQDKFGLIDLRTDPQRVPITYAVVQTVNVPITQNHNESDIIAAVNRRMNFKIIIQNVPLGDILLLAPIDAGEHLWENNTFSAYPCGAVQIMPSNWEPHMVRSSNQALHADITRNMYNLRTSSEPQVSLINNSENNVRVIFNELIYTKKWTVLYGSHTMNEERRNYVLDILHEEPQIEMIIVIGHNINFPANRYEKIFYVEQLPRMSFEWLLMNSPLPVLIEGAGTVEFCEYNSIAYLLIEPESHATGKDYFTNLIMPTEVLAKMQAQHKQLGKLFLTDHPPTQEMTEQVPKHLSAYLMNLENVKMYHKNRSIAYKSQYIDLIKMVFNHACL